MKLTELAFFTPHVQEMADFYRRLLGSAPVAESADMAIFLSGETRIFIHRTYTPGEGDLPPENHTAFAVENVDAACRRLQAQGLEIQIPPADYYWGRSAYLRDPEGRLLEITQAKER